MHGAGKVKHQKPKTHLNLTAHFKTRSIFKTLSNVHDKTFL